jgi:cytochrome b561
MTFASPWAVPPPTTHARRYNRVAMVLHWIIAALIVLQACLGWYMNEILGDHSPARPPVVGLHISVGLTILMLVIVRIGWRLTNPPPPLPAGLAPWERILSGTVHTLFYILMLALPLTGWAVVSAGKHPLLFWGVPWPKIPGLTGLSRDQHHLLSHTHVFILMWILVISWFLHVGGALKHQFDGNPVLWRMIPFLKPRGWRRP